MAHIVELERHRLADGGLAILKKFGRTYTFTRTYPDYETPPDNVDGLSKAEAYDLLGDTLRSDVMEEEY